MKQRDALPPAMGVKMWPLDKIKPYPGNPRTHPPAQVTLLANLMKRHGIDQSIVVDDDGVILKGHGRRLAAIEAGLTEYPVVQRGGLDDAEKRAMRIADNQVALLSGWDHGLISAEISGLKLEGFNIPLLGFPEKQLKAFGIALGTDGAADPEKAIEPPKDPVSRPGDIWILGNHRLICGDSTDRATVAKVLDGRKPMLMVTDPPYGVDYDPNWRNERARTSSGMGSRAIGAGAVGRVLNDDKADWRKAWELFPGDVAYVWHADLRASSVWTSLEASGFQIRAQIIWNKNTHVIGRGHYHFKHEPCFYTVRAGKNARWNGSRAEMTVWDIAKPQASESGHSTQKPVECMRRPMENNSVPGEAIYEPFCGSGTTIIAAEMTNRHCLAVELNPAYVDVAVRRWEAFAGQKAVLEATGALFSEVALDRAKAGKTRQRPAVGRAGAKSPAKKPKPAKGSV